MVGRAGFEPATN